MNVRSVALLEKELEELEKQAGLKPQEDPEDTTTEEVEEVEEVVEATEVEKTSPEEKNWAKRYADLRTLQQKTAAKLKEAESKNATPAAVTEDQVKDWIKTNPKAAEIIKTIAVQSSPVEDLNAIKEEIAQNKARNAIMKAHPDFEEISEDDAFHEWADKQPQRVQELIFSDEPDAVIWALSFYKEQTAPKGDAKKDAARLVRTKSGTDAPSDKKTQVYSESVVQKMSLQDYEKHEAAIIASQRAGNFIYDLSGGAR